MTKQNKSTPTGNKGEWSEFYAFIKILTDGRVFTADKNLKILEDHFHLVLKIIRQEATSVKSYDISKNDGRVFISENNAEIGVVDLSQIKASVASIFEHIKESSGSFEITSAADTMSSLHCTQIKASSGKKADLTIVLHDKKSPEFPELGFSIKSMLGSPATLLNASGATNFVYRISTGDKKLTVDSNDMSVREVTRLAYGAGDNLEFIGMDNEVFRQNLRKVDSVFPKVVSQMLKYYYNGSATTIVDLVDRVSEDAEFMKDVDFTKNMLIMNMKRFLSSVALGMMPAKDWDGYTEAYGGYIIVKDNGDVVCYHLYNRDKFEDYLFYNTKLDTPSTTRHGFGKIYEEHGEQRMKLNLQIRFLK